MKRRHAVIIALVSAAAAAGLTAAPAPGSLYAVSAAEAGSSDSRRAHIGGRHGMRGDHGPGRLCSTANGDHIDDGIQFIERFVGFTPDQALPWQDLSGEVRAASGLIAKACEDLKDASAPATAPERLARLEAAVVTGLEALRRVRPAFERFYAVLDDKQKAALDGLATQRRRH